jgi:sugar-specific transcriptional regulator TrmB
MKDLVQRLITFGLSVNQAKVYLSIVHSSEANINTISSATKIHRQDIYKILPKLEDMGLITKTVEHPLVIRAIPPEKALKHIITTEQEKANKKIKNLKQTIKSLTEAIEKNKDQSRNKQKQNKIEVAFLSTDNAINHSLDTAFGNARVECESVINFELMYRRLPLLEKRYQALAKNNIQTRILVDKVQNFENAIKILESIIPEGDFEIRQSGKITVKPYVILDNKEIYISTQRKTSHNYPCVLWTNSENIIQIYKDNFERAWKLSIEVLCRKRRKRNEHQALNVDTEFLTQ